MTTIALSTLRSRLRTYLKDTDEKNWPDSNELDLFLNHAIVMYTTDLPIASIETYTVADDQQADEHTYLLPTDFVYDYFLRATFDAAVAENVGRINYQYGAWDTGDEPKGYLIDWPSEGYLYLPREPGSTTFTFYYGAFWEDELEEDTDTFDLGRNRWGEQAVLCYACYLAFNPASSSRAQLAQWARKSDQRVGNPLEEEAARWLARYKELISGHAEVPSTWEFARSTRA